MSKKLYSAIDLHSHNSFLAIIDEDERVVFQGRLKNDLEPILDTLHPFRDQLVGVAVESTFNWYWLVDGLMDAGYHVDLVNTAAIQQYEGLKYTNDCSDATWLARMKLLSILPTGYIYPRDQRGLRELVRRRMRLVQLRTSCILGVQGIQQRELGARMTTNQIKTQDPETLAATVSDHNVAMALRSTQNVIMTLLSETRQIEQLVLKQVRPSDSWKHLMTIWGIGKILASTILLETGPIERFSSAGHFASYCRCVPATRVSNGKKKGKGNAKNGNRYLCWAFIEAAEFAIRSYPIVNSWYHRKAAKTKPVVARKALAHKLARATFHVLRDGVPFRSELLFGS